MTFASKTAADRWLSKKRTEVDAGTSMDDQAGKKPLGDWWEPYWRQVKGTKRARTRQNYGASWRLRCEPRFGKTPVRRVTPAAVDEWIADMIDEGVSPAKIIESVGVLRRVLDLAVRDRAIPVNPCSQRRLPLPRMPKKDRPVLSPAEVEKIAQAMRSEEDGMLVRVLAFGGLRIGEALALSWSHVDLKRKVFKVAYSVESQTGPITVTETKSYATRSVPIPDSMIEGLNGMQGTGLVFPNKFGGHMRYRNWRRDAWDKAIEKAGVEALPHDLRATFASLLIDAGASPIDVKEAMGHEDITTTLNLYARVRPGRSQDLAKRLDALIAEAG